MNLEELQNELLELREKVKELTSELESTKTDNTAKDDRIKSLEEHNQKLFLKATSSTSKQDDKIENDNFASDILGDYAKLLSDDEVEQLKEIMEEI